MKQTCGNNDSTAGLQATVSALDVHELLQANVCSKAGLQHMKPCWSASWPQRCKQHNCPPVVLRHGHMECFLRQLGMSLTSRQQSRFLEQMFHMLYAESIMSDTIKCTLKSLKHCGIMHLCHIESTVNDKPTRHSEWHNQKHPKRTAKGSTCCGLMRICQGAAPQ